MKKEKDYIEVSSFQAASFLIGLGLLIFFIGNYYSHESWCQCKDDRTSIGFTSSWNYTEDCDNRCGGPNTSLTLEEYTEMLQGFGRESN